MSAWTFTPMTQADAEEIAGWHYPGEYAFYDADFIPESAGELLDPARRGDQYHAARNAAGELEGFAQLEPVEGATEIGLGLRPDLTGRGLGGAFTVAVIDLARRHGAGRITLAVATSTTVAVVTRLRVGDGKRSANAEVGGLLSCQTTFGPGHLAAQPQGLGHQPAGLAHQDLGPAVIVAIGSARDPGHPVATQVADVGLVAAVEVGVVCGAHVPSTAPVLVAHAEVRQPPGLVSSILAAQVRHG